MAVVLRILAVSAAFEVATGLALMVVPDAVTQLLLGDHLSGAGVPVGHVAGVALLCLGIACWPYFKESRNTTPVVAAIAVYNLLVAAYLLFLGLLGSVAGPLLWPAAALHFVIGIAVTATWLRA